MLALQLHIVYNLEHEDIEPLFRVCQELRSMVRPCAAPLLRSVLHWALCLGSCAASLKTVPIIADAHSYAVTLHIYHPPPAAI